MDRKDILAFIEAEIDRLTQARDLLKGGRTSAYPSSRSSADYRTGSNGERRPMATEPGQPRHKRRRMSRQTKRKISETMKKRWAQKRK